MKRLIYLIMFFSGFTHGQGPSVIAHRGGAGLAPENTLAAFNNAVALNADYYELDVMISADDSLMIMHDATVNRTTDGSGNVSSLTYAQLKELDAGSWFGPEFTGEEVPTLWESLLVAKNSPNDIGVVIEIKSSDSSVPPKVVAMVQKLNMQNRVIVSGFSLAQITEVKNLDPTIPVQLFGTITESNLDQVAAINGEWVGSGGNFTQAVIDYAHSQGIYYNAWTLNAASTMVPAIELGVDAITTDFPDVMINLLDETAPSDVVLSSAIAEETHVTLIWEPAIDEESGIAGYEIYRDETPDATTLLITTENVTEYVDETYMENETYYYRIKAKNPGGKTSPNYSNEIEVTTQNDNTPPEIEAITSRGNNNTVVISFSERVDRTTAETSAYYSLNKGVVVVATQLTRDLRSVILTTSDLSEQSYLLTVSNVTDRALSPNTMETASNIFLHYAIPDGAVAFYQLDSIYFADPDYVVYDETMNENTGFTKNGPYTTEGMLGNAIGFDGIDDYVMFNPSESFDINGSEVTLSLWAKLAYKPSELPVSYAPLFDSETDNYVLYGDRGNNELRFKVSTSGGAERPGIPNVDIPANEWIHVVGVYDGSNAMIYFNGVLKDSHPLTGTVKTGQLATMGKTGSTYYEGSIDQVEVYNQAFTPEEVMELYKFYRMKDDMECEITEFSEDIAVCYGESYDFPDGNAGSETMVYVSELKDVNDCDLIITTNLTVNPAIDVSVSLDLNQVDLTVAATGATYQWLDCDNNNAPISGATDRTFIPFEFDYNEGNFAVEVTIGNCSAISDCYFIKYEGTENFKKDEFFVYPNPGSGLFTIHLGPEFKKNTHLQIINNSGQIILKKNLKNNGDHRIDLSRADPGLYLVRISSGSKKLEKKLMIF